MKTILVPCDFSTPSIEAFKFAIDMARISKGEVIVLNIIDLPIIYESTFGMQPYAFDPFIVKELESEATQRYETLVRQHGKGAVATRFVTAQGPVTAMIRQQIDLQKVDLVVMGTHGATGLKEYFVGSNTEKIVRYSPVPVFAIRTAIPVDKVKNIVFATTLDLNQTELIKKVTQLQEFFNAMLHVLVVNTPNNFRRDKELKDALENYALHYKLSNYTLNMRNDAFEIDGILSFALETKSEIIAMATHGHRGLFHLLTGSIAEDVVNHGTCPIWTYSLHKK
jgi:nucleotide-binding universal stress UspA family protein